MSDLSQFMGKAFPLGASISAPYMGDTFTAEDGSIWLSNNSHAAFAYSSTYANTPSVFLSPHSLINGPHTGGWYMPDPALSTVAYKSSSTLYCTGGRVTTLLGDGTNGYLYHTSGDGGANWTQRTFPNTKAYQVVYAASKFIGAAVSSTTNGIITGTDAVNWSSGTGISITTIGDIVSDGSNNIVIFPASGTAGASSTDGGSTFGAATFTATPGTAFGVGNITWNAGASLFIAATSTAGAYQTSPTGATWTLRNVQATFLPYQLWFGTSNVHFASNSTTTVVVGNGGFFATTTDGLTWANHGFIDQGRIGSALCSALFYDGTRFVVFLSNGAIYYSTYGTAWTAASSFGVTVPASNTVFFNGRAIRLLGNAATGLSPSALLMADVSVTSPAIVVPPLPSSNLAFQSVSYWRIK